jgi:hypothetical protein
MPLPGPYELQARIVEIIAAGSNCEITYATHPGPLKLLEFLAIRKAIGKYLTDLANANLDAVSK